MPRLISKMSQIKDLAKMRNIFLLLFSIILISGCAQDSIQTINTDGPLEESETQKQIQKLKGEISTDENDLTKTKGMGNLCSSLHDCFVFCRDHVGLCTNFCKKNPSHELCKMPEPAKPQEWVKDSITQPLPEGASSVRLVLPAPLEDIALPQVGAFGAHPVGHAEGLDHEWIWIKDSSPIKSWADGVVVFVNDAEGGSVDTPNIVIYYGDGLWGEHMHVQKSLVKLGDKIKAGDPVAYGELYPHMPGYQFAEFNVADQHRRDGVGYWYKFAKGATLVSPFDYLRDDVKKELSDKLNQEVIEKYLSKGEEVSGIIPVPWEPYLTNPILFHINYPERLEGEWFLRSKPWGVDGVPDIVIFFPPHKYYPRQRLLQVDDDRQQDRAEHLLSGDWEADYSKKRLTITAHDITYYGIFELDESKPQATLKIEYQKDSYPPGFSDKALLYSERERISKGEETHYWEHPEDDPINWE